MKRVSGVVHIVVSFGLNMEEIVDPQHGLMPIGASQIEAEVMAIISEFPEQLDGSHIFNWKEGAAHLSDDYAVVDDEDN